MTNLNERLPAHESEEQNTRPALQNPEIKCHQCGKALCVTQPAIKTLRSSVITVAVVLHADPVVCECGQVYIFQVAGFQGLQFRLLPVVPQGQEPAAQPGPLIVPGEGVNISQLSKEINSLKEGSGRG